MVICRKAARGHVVAIEDGHVIGEVMLSERVVDVAGLGVLVVRTDHVSDARLDANFSNSLRRPSSRM